ncbi:MAG: hypothetical protein HXS52_08520 [Theionarchaea archaeon]|nr:hypothetical protein [Theionarchaea archaeon]MBU7037962.1 hypothetical protein [Theionarchaea archaeon]
MKPFLTTLALCSIVVTVLAPPEAKLAAVFVLLLLPGAGISLTMYPKRDFVDQMVFSVLCGLGFQIVYGYFLSMVSHFSLVSLSVPAVAFSLLADFKAMKTVSLDKKSLLIFVPALLFGLATWNVVPGEDAIAHLLIIEDIVQEAAVPQTYLLYPEIPTIIYPLGVHILTAQLELFSGMNNLIFGMASFLAAVLCLSIYWFTKTMFSTEMGLLAGVLAVFSTLPPLNSVILSNYSTLLAYVMTCAAIGVIVNLNSRKDFRLWAVLALLLAAGAESHLLFFVVLIPLSVLLVQELRKKPRSWINYVLIIGLAAVFCLPFLLRISSAYIPSREADFSSVEYLVRQESHFFQRFSADLVPRTIGIWITLVGALGFFLLQKYRLFFGVWAVTFLFLALNSAMGIEFPLWYTFFAPRMIDQLFIPFSVMGAFFLLQMKDFSRPGAVILSGILLLSGCSYILQTPRADRGELFPTTSPFFENDQKGMIWLLQTEQESIILNDWWTGTGSAWIPSLTRRKVVFPYTVNAFSINVFARKDYVKALNLAQKEQKSFLIAAYPDSKEAHAYLKEWHVDYIFLSSYVLEESKWRAALWNPYGLTESPNYELVFQDGYTYIFNVNSEFEYSTTFRLKELGEVNVEQSTPTELDVSLGLLSFPVDRILDIQFEDEGLGQIEVRTGDSLLALIPQTDSKSMVHVAFRLPLDVERITLSCPDRPITVAASVTTTFMTSISCGNTVFIGTSWQKVESGCELYDQGHIYLINPSGEVALTYLDVGEGNVDLNVFLKGEWQKVTTIYRENDGLKKTIVLKMPEGYTLLDVGIKTWGDPLVLVAVE